MSDILSRRNKRRFGLTLIELIVVLVILVALAGILVVTLPGMLGRAHTASGATNEAEITKFVQVYEQLYQSYPTDLDALTDAAGTTEPDYLPGGATPVGGQVTARTLTTVEASALEAAGITRLVAMHPSKADFTADNSPTFNPYITGVGVEVANTVGVLKVTEAAVETTVVSDEPTLTGDVYLMFGFGKRCSMIGKVASDAPTHFGEGAQDNAATVYGRYGLIFRVARGNGTATPTPLERAVFIGTVAMHDDGIVGVDAHLEEYYNITKSSQ